MELKELNMRVSNLENIVKNQQGLIINLEEKNDNLQDRVMIMDTKLDRFEAIFNALKPKANKKG